MNELMSVPSVQRAWPLIRAHLRGCLPSAQKLTASHIAGLGPHLSEAFKAGEPATAGMDPQAKASIAGAVWEGLIVWYLNICLAGSRSVAIKKKSHAPASVANSMSVVLNAGGRLSEPDVLIVTLDSNKVDDVLARWPTAAWRKNVDDNFGDCCVINIQCKSNWNDTLQTPMLWNLLYDAARNLSAAAGNSLQLLGGNRISFGQSGFYIKDLKGFCYAFVTAPSDKVTNFSVQSVHVLRTRFFTGGAFWGRPTSPNICTSFQEFFNVNSTALASGLVPGLGFTSSNQLVNKAVFDFP